MVELARPSYKVHHLFEELDGVEKGGRKEIKKQKRKNYLTVMQHVVSVVDGEYHESVTFVSGF